MNANHKTTYFDRLAELRRKIDKVAAVLETCDGYPARAGDIDLRVASFFAGYIEWELNNPDLMKDALIGNEVFADENIGPLTETLVKVDEKERERRYAFHIDYELTGCMDILNQAMARLDSEVKLPVVSSIDWNRVELKNGYLRIGERPVFSGGFNMLEWSFVDLEQHPEWAEKDASSTQAFLLDMKKLGVGIISSCGIPVSGLILPDGSVDTVGIRKQVEEIEASERLGFRVDVMLAWPGNSGILEPLWPGITKYYGNGVGFDIDHPGARDLISKVFSKLVPALNESPAVLSWDMANEPFFSLKMWSPHSLAGYHRWLAEKYGDVESLNRIWKTKYGEFHDIPLPDEKPRERCSAGEWYDRVTFHNTRVASFFGFVQAEIRKYVPDAVIHLKGQDNSSLGPRPEAVTEGIDRELLTPSSSMQGTDTRPLPVTEPRMAAGGKDRASATGLNYDGSLYGFHWLGQSFLYDYLTSLQPSQPMIDLEYHAFSINAIRIPDIPRSHARATLWLAHFHGLISNATWYWHRRYGPYPFPLDYFVMWLYGSISTQPTLAAEYFHTLLGLNAFAEEVEALATFPDRPVRLLVSKPSYVQTQAHIDALHRAYEGTCFHGLRIGCVTEKTLVDTGVPSDCKVIVLPDVEYIGREALQVLEYAGRKGVRLIRFGEREPAYDPHGIPHAREATAFLEDVPVLGYASAPVLSREFERILSPLATALQVRVNVVNGTGAFGVMHRQVPFGGYKIVLLVNVSPGEVSVQLHTNEGDTVDGYDLLNCEEMKGDGIDLPFQSVRLIKMSL
jgi:hypothetical protein